MKLLNKVSTPPSYISRHNLIVNSKINRAVKTQLELISAPVSDRYNIFEAHVNGRTIHDLQQDALMLANRDALQSCYKNKTLKIKEIFSEIVKASNERLLERCPYCGLTLPTTYDHYLPEDKYPEFSAHALNLVPCCNVCNSTKSNYWINRGERLFLHFYSDPIPTDQFLFVTLRTMPNSLAYGVRFTLSDNCPNNYTINDWGLINSHFERLSLLEKYQDQSNSEISNTFTSCVSHMRDGGLSVSNFLAHICDNEEQVFGVNHWRVVLKRSLAESVDFENHVVNYAAI